MFSSTTDEQIYAALRSFLPLKQKAATLSDESNKSGVSDFERSLTDTGAHKLNKTKEAGMKVSMLDHDPTATSQQLYILQEKFIRSKAYVHKKISPQ